MYGAGKSLSGHESAGTAVREERPAVLRSRSFLSSFMRRFSAVAAPIVVLPKISLECRGQKAFSELKRRFGSQPILITPSPSPLVVEVDASEVGLGAILSQIDLIFSNRPGRIAFIFLQVYQTII